MPIPRIAAYEVPRAGNWPPCRASWSFDPTRAALLVHDMQSYFLHPYPPNVSPLAPLLEHVKALHTACKSVDVPVIFSVQPGEQTQRERGLLWDLWGPGIVEHPEQGSVVPQLTVEATDVLLPKRRYSAFHDTPLPQLLRDQKRDQLLICGVYAHIGCLATATDAFMYGFQPFLIADATADFSREDHLVALRQVARTCGVVATTREILEPIYVQRLRTILTEVLDAPADGIDLDDDLSDHGLDSVRALSFFERVLPPDHGLEFSDLIAARSLRKVSALLSVRVAASH